MSADDSTSAAVASAVAADLAAGVSVATAPAAVPSLWPAVADATAAPAAAAAPAANEPAAAQADLPAEGSEPPPMPRLPTALAVAFAPGNTAPAAAAPALDTTPENATLPPAAATAAAADAVASPRAGGGGSDAAAAQPAVETMTEKFNTVNRDQRAPALAISDEPVGKLSIHAPATGSAEQMLAKAEAAAAAAAAQPAATPTSAGANGSGNASGGITPTAAAAGGAKASPPGASAPPPASGGPPPPAAAIGGASRAAFAAALASRAAPPAIPNRAAKPAVAGFALASAVVTAGTAAAAAAASSAASTAGATPATPTSATTTTTPGTAPPAAAAAPAAPGAPQVPGAKPAKPTSKPPPLAAGGAPNGYGTGGAPINTALLSLAPLPKKDADGKPIAHPALPPTPASPAGAAPASAATPPPPPPPPPPPQATPASPPTPATAEEKAAKQVRLRLKVLDEIVETERAYVASLQALQTHFIDPLTSRATDSSARLLTKAEIDDMFSNISNLLALNTIFLRDIQKRAGTGPHWSSDPATQNIGDIFLQFVPAMKMYASYTCNHEAANNLLAKLASNEKFQAFAQGASGHKDCRGNSLASFLIMPIQRIPRYKLLLSSLMDLTPPTHPDRAKLTKSLDLVSDVALYINEQVRRQENREETRKLDERFMSSPGFLKEQDRMLLRIGELTKLSRSKDQVCTFFLFSDVLVYAKKVAFKYKLSQILPIDLAFVVSEVAKPGAAPAPATPATPAAPGAAGAAPAGAAGSAAPASMAKELGAGGKLELGGVIVMPETGQVTVNSMYQFQIQSTKKSFVVNANSVADKKIWFDHISEVVEKRRKLLGGGAAGDANARAVWAQDHTEKVCPLCRAEFGLLTRRHHCRKCGRLCCDACSRARVVLNKSDPKAPEERVCDPCKIALANPSGPSAASLIAAAVANAGKDPAQKGAAADPTKPKPADAKAVASAPATPASPGPAPQVPSSAASPAPAAPAGTPVPPTSPAPPSATIGGAPPPLSPRTADLGGGGPALPANTNTTMKLMSAVMATPLKMPAPPSGPPPSNTPNINNSASMTQAGLLVLPVGQAPPPTTPRGTPVKPVVTPPTSVHGTLNTTTANTTTQSNGAGGSGSHPAVAPATASSSSSSSSNGVGAPAEPPMLSAQIDPAKKTPPTTPRGGADAPATGATPARSSVEGKTPAPVAPPAAAAGNTTAGAPATPGGSSGAGGSGAKPAPPKPSGPKPALLKQLTRPNPTQADGAAATDAKTDAAAAAAAAPAAAGGSSSAPFTGHVLMLPAGQKLPNTFRVPEAETLNEGGQKYTVYKVKVKTDAPNQPLVSKRFSQFQEFDKLLRKLFPSYMQAIAFPPQKVFGNFDANVIEERRKAFQTWLDAIVDHREMWPPLATWLDVPLDKWRQ